MPDLKPIKPISKDAIPTALQRAERYRLLNEPEEAESICLDILEVDPQHREARIALLLALTDQFQEHGAHAAEQRARSLLEGMSDYERAYYGGLICERKAKAVLARNYPRSRYDAHEWLHEAMALYEEAEKLRAPGNDEAILRWNTCARLIERHRLESRPAEGRPAMLE